MVPLLLGGKAALFYCGTLCAFQKHVIISYLQTLSNQKQVYSVGVVPSKKHTCHYNSTDMDMAAILVMGSDSCHQIFISLYLKAFIKYLVQIGAVVSEKILFEFLYVHDFGPRQRNDLDLQYSLTFIYSIRCLLLQTLRSLAAIVSKKSTVFTFSHRKA